MPDRVPKQNADSQNLASTDPRCAAPIDIAIGKRIAACRKAHDLSQAALGKAVGVSNTQIKKYETGADRVGAGRLNKIARFLDVSLTALYGEDEADPGKSKTLNLLAVPGAIDLLNTFAEIQDPDVRQALVMIARSTARRSRPTSS